VICLWSVPVEGMKSEEKSVKQSPTSQIQGKSLVIKPVSGHRSRASSTPSKPVAGEEPWSFNLLISLTLSNSHTYFHVYQSPHSSVSHHSLFTHQNRLKGKLSLFTVRSSGIINQWESSDCLKLMTLQLELIW